MQGVVLTLLDNAIRFSPPGGRSTCTWPGRPPTALVRVTDTGPGIDPAYLPRLFDAFAPADIAHHTAGLGVSLAIAQQITRAHQGTIEVESAAETGTTFTVRLPHAPAWSHETVPHEEGEARHK